MCTFHIQLCRTAHVSLVVQNRYIGTDTYIYIHYMYVYTCSLLLHSDVLILIQLRQQRGPSQDPKTGVRQTGQPYPHDKICTLTRRRQHPSSFTGFVHRAVVRLCPSLLLCRLLLLNNSRTHTIKNNTTHCIVVFTQKK